MNAELWLPVIFAGLMAISLLAYVILDGYDLGVGVLLPLGSDSQRDTMIASIGPFWDANETWLVLGVGLLLVAFPMAHGVILGALYLPVAAMLVGLILRGVAFDFRAKAHDEHRVLWNAAFSVGSLAAARHGHALQKAVVTGDAGCEGDQSFGGTVGGDGLSDTGGKEQKHQGQGTRQQGERQNDSVRERAFSPRRQRQSSSQILPPS